MPNIIQADVYNKDGLMFCTKKLFESLYSATESIQKADITQKPIY